MRYLFFILLFANQFSIAQETSFNLQLQGIWWLNTVQVENFVENSTEKITSGVNTNYGLEITEDSVFFRNPELRFYKRPDEGFIYSVSYDSIFKSNQLNLFRGKGKHKQLATSYTFRLVNGKLILSSTCEPDANFDMLNQTNYYTYSRYKDEEKLYEKISGVWFTKNDHLNDSPVSDTIYYWRKNLVQSDFTGVEVLFKTVHGEPRMSYEYSYSMNSGTNEIYDGVYVTADCEITMLPDQKELIIGNDERKTIFKILELTDDSMKLLRTTN